MAKAKLMPSLGNQPKARYEKPKTVKKNNFLLGKLSDRIDSLLIVSDTLMIGYQKTIDFQEPVSIQLEKLNIESVRLIENSTQKFIGDRRFSELSESWGLISSTGMLIDSLEQALYEKNEILKKTYRAINETNSRIRSDISLSQKLIIQNCRLAGMDQCSGEKFKAFSTIKRKTYFNNIELLSAYQKMINRDFDSYKVSHDLLTGQLKLLDENKKYISYFKLSSLGNIAFKRNIGLFEMYYLNKKSNLAIKKLARENIALYKRKRRS